jgi:hypothetical protein
MTGKRMDLTLESVKDTWDDLFGNAFNGFLNNVISVLILEQLHNVLSHFSYELALLIDEDMVQCLQGLAFYIDC